MTEPLTLRLVSDPLTRKLPEGVLEAQFHAKDHSPILARVFLDWLLHAARQKEVLFYLHKTPKGMIPFGRITDIQDQKVTIYPYGEGSGFVPKEKIANLKLLYIANRGNEGIKLDLIVRELEDSKPYIVFS